MADLQLDLARVRRALARPPRRLQPASRRASVAVLLTPSLELLLMQRAEHPDDPWSGHISFPGGRQDPEDPDPLAAALRETREEIGLELSSQDLLGELDEVRTVGVSPGMVIRPHVFRIPPDPPVEPNYEVAALHYVPLPRLLVGERRRRFELRRGEQSWELPEVPLAEGVRLWGLTLHMVDDLLDRLDGRGLGLARLTG